MKKIVLILLSVMFYSCGIAQVEQAPLYKVNAWVQKIDGDVATLQPSDPGVTYEVPAGDLIAEKECVFWLDILDNSGRTRKATVEKWAYTTVQAQRDQTAAAKELSHRTIIKQ